MGSGVFGPCALCGQLKRDLLLNVCVECDPELHAAFDAAVKSFFVEHDGDLYNQETKTLFKKSPTPEMSACMELMDKRLMEGWGTGKPVGVLNTRTVRG